MIGVIRLELELELLEMEFGAAGAGTAGAGTAGGGAAGAGAARGELLELELLELQLELDRDGAHAGSGGPYEIGGPTGTGHSTLLVIDGYYLVEKAWSIRRAF